MYDTYVCFRWTVNHGARREIYGQTATWWLLVVLEVVIDQLECCRCLTRKPTLWRRKTFLPIEDGMFTH